MSSTSPILHISNVVISILLDHSVVYIKGKILKVKYKLGIPNCSGSPLYVEDVGGLEPRLIVSGLEMNQELVSKMNGKFV
nr:MAG TPA: hypothetical protein [Caudoviricetes sp.]